MLRSGGGAPGAPGPAGAAGAPGTAGQTVGNALLDGGGVVHLTDLDIRVSAASYIINGANYTSAQTDLTIGTADATHTRIDVVALNTSGAVVIVPGVAAANPFEPVLDPNTQLRLTAFPITAGATTLTTTNTIIFTEGGGESWTETASGAPVDVANATNPITGSVSVRVTAGVSGNYAQFANSGDFDTTTRSTLALTIKNDAAWPSQKSLVLQWYDGTIARGTPVTIRDGLYGFSRTDITTNRQIVIPLQAFGVAGLAVDTLRATISGGGGSMNFVMDDIYMQAGIASVGTSTGMQWRGAYSAAVQYVLNDVVGYLGQIWRADQSLIGVTPGGTGWTLLPTFGIPQNSKSAAYTTVLSDAGKHLLHPAADANARTFTIDSNANVPYSIGTAITFVNETSQVLSIAITSDTLTLANSTTSGTRSLAQNGVATALKVTSTKWVISGSGLT